MRFSDDPAGDLKVRFTLNWLNDGRFAAASAADLDAMDLQKLNLGAGGRQGNEGEIVIPSGQSTFSVDIRIVADH